jgi:pimeloyl-ACP methyl ester carboxylesterase
MPSQAEHPASATATTLAPAPATSHFVEAGDVRLHYLDYGTAGRPPMVCIHGGAAHGHWFDYIAPGFTPEYHVRAFDLRGHGDSDPVDPPSYYYQDYAADLNKAFEKMDLRDFVLVGHSMGGAVSLLYSATYPGRVKKLVIVDTSINLPPERIAKLRDVGSKPGRDYDTQEEILARYKLRPGESLAKPEVVRHIASHSARQLADGKWRYKFDRAVYATRESMDGMPLWSDIKIPALLVKGDRSERITPQVYADVKARAPQAELAEVSNSDHHVTLDNPTEFIDVLQRFLAQH